MAQISRLPDGRFRIRVYSHKQQGRPVMWRDQVVGCASLREAQAMARRWEVERDQERASLSAPGREAGVGEWREWWLRRVLPPRVGARTLNWYADITRRHLLPALGGRRMSSVTRAVAQNLISDLHEQGLGPRTLRHVRGVAGVMWKDAREGGVRCGDPWRGLRLPRERAPERKALTREEVSRLLTALRGNRYELLFRFALATGLRPEEYLALKWGDLDLGRGLVHVRRALIQGVRGVRPRTDRPKTHNSLRSVPVEEDLVRALGDVRGEALDDELVFANGKGDPIADSYLRDFYFKPACRRAGLPAWVSLYTLRHTFATHLIEGGVNPRIVQTLLGHARVSFTLAVYVSALPESVEAARGVLSRLLRQLEGKAEALAEDPLSMVQS